MAPAVERHEGNLAVSAGHKRASSVSLLQEGTDAAALAEDLKKVRIYSGIVEYEDTLAALVESVDSYKPDMAVAQRLVDADKELFASLDKFKEYDEISTRLGELKGKSTALDTKTRDILEKLNECHDELNKLPYLEQVQFEMDTILEQREKINSSELLDYATKLSKFTRIPPTFDKGSIGPNNFIWPAEDALRKGMLAIAALHSRELTRIPGQDDAEDKKKQTEKPDVPEPAPVTEERRSSFVFGDTSTADDQKSSSAHSDHDDDDAMDLDLDLFNPDEF
ncbi:Med4p KNAG_0M01020 [Huiozyma naganishii CBS 8797]|uniref:Mediator of RNA polymerase II transcription subunit 4 n=1 Tax=Huiozyma naganishii (strain ATCC MYA-139 / BCRC 22969 / CBS 8797 / KCTC 17520 / NBRC 10181 / NCYC 3082 / Yp74L-3) TaxID=1071383 RepID=J7RDK3_HUIN7|nr:hypothetical protein KNAG_0M01020 [Kazachstania naganishii CBS 8797]CCK72955.1 hypothetical protein KNAG_0M01020 [Kazachstania naganishii CBS 8797]